MPFVLNSPPIVSKKREFRDYQQEAYDKFKDSDSAFLAMEMRLGKSFVAVRLSRDAWKCQRVFVFAPGIVLLTWEEEFRKSGIAYHNLVGLTNEIRSNIIDENSPGYFLLNYEALLDRRVANSICQYPPDCVILDESTIVKNAKAKVTKFFLQSCDLFRKKILLSGLPTPEDWSNIWSQCAILNNGRWMGTSNFFKWLKYNSTKDTYGHFFSPAQATKLREEFRSFAYCLSRSHANLGESKIRTIRSGELPRKERKIYDKIKRDWEVDGLDIESTETNYAMVITSWMQRLCGGFLPKDECESWKYLCVQDLLNTDLKNERVVVWCAFNDEIHRLQSLLKPASSVAILTGETRQPDRQSAITRFRSNGVRILIVQQRLGKFGLDLSCANTAIYFSNSYNLEHRAQSEDRIVMPGKKEPLLYIDLITKDTVEEEIYCGLRDKKVDAKWLVARARKVDVD